MKMRTEKSTIFFEDEVPYDLNAPVIEIRREDYGIWYVDMMENPDRYKGKVVEFVAKVMKPRAFPSKRISSGTYSNDLLCR